MLKNCLDFFTHDLLPFLSRINDRIFWTVSPFIYINNVYKLTLLLLIKSNKYEKTPFSYRMLAYGRYDDDGAKGRNRPRHFE